MEMAPRKAQMEAGHQAKLNLACGTINVTVVNPVINFHQENATLMDRYGGQ